MKGAFNRGAPEKHPGGIGRAIRKTVGIYIKGKQPVLIWLQRMEAETVINC
jgi:hypothetical protein